MGNRARSFACPLFYPALEPEPRKLPVRFYEIDALRFLAALSVVFYHYTFCGYAANTSPIAFPELGRITRYGYLGVELFFIISGYVVLLSAQGKTVRQFFISRVTRLYPAFWVACTLTFLVKYIWGKGPNDPQMSPYLHVSVRQYGLNLTMLQDFLGVTSIDGAYWSLAVEITFYFLISLLIGYALMRHVDWFLAGWLVYTAYAGGHPAPTVFATLFFPAYSPYFAAGMLFYLLQRPEGRTRMRYALLAIAYLLAVRQGFYRAQELTEFFHSDISRKVAVAAISGFFGVFYLVAFRKINLSRWTWLAVPGALTYPLYLLHCDIGVIAFHRLNGHVNKYLLVGTTILLMLVAAHLVHVMLEKRLSKQLGQWLTKTIPRMLGS